MKTNEYEQNPIIERARPLKNRPYIPQLSHLINAKIPFRKVHSVSLNPVTHPPDHFPAARQLPHLPSPVSLAGATPPCPRPVACAAQIACKPNGANPKRVWGVFWFARALPPEKALLTTTCSLFRTPARSSAKMGRTAQKHQCLLCV